MRPLFPDISVAIQNASTSNQGMHSGRAIKSKVFAGANTGFFVMLFEGSPGVIK